MFVSGTVVETLGPDYNRMYAQIARMLPRSTLVMHSARVTGLVKHYGSSVDSSTPTDDQLSQALWEDKKHQRIKM